MKADRFPDAHPFSNSTAAGVATYGSGARGACGSDFESNTPDGTSVITIKELGTILGQAARDGGSSSLVDALR